MTRFARSIRHTLPLLLAALVTTAAPPAPNREQEETFDRALSVQPARHTAPEDVLRPRQHPRHRGQPGGDTRRAPRPRDRLRDITLEVTQSGNNVEIEANHQQVERDNDNVVETDFDIQVPQR